MEQPVLSRLHRFRHIIMGGLIVAFAGATLPAQAQDYRDSRWREHQRHEEQMAAQRARDRAHARAEWDHRYWDRDRGVYVYRPPVVYYAPPPPTGIDLFFRFGR